MIHINRVRVFDVNLFYVTCSSCKAWVKSGVGQYVWEQRRQAVTNAKRHVGRYHKDLLT